MSKTQQARRITPIGEAKWAHLNKPKPAFIDDQGRAQGAPKFQIDIVFDPKSDPAWMEWAKDISAKIKALPEQKNKSGDVVAKQNPIKKELDADDQPTGRYYVTMKTGEKFKPQIFDRFGKPMPEETLVGNGSKVRLAYVENTYSAFGGGLNFYLNACQVLDLVEYQSKTAESYGFTTEEAPPDTSFDVDSF